MTVTVACEAADPSSATEAGEMEQLAWGGAPLQASANSPLNPAKGVAVSFEVDVRPAEALNWAGEMESEKSASETLRDKEAICCPLGPVTS
jgi:hypothetical protein